MIDIGQCADHSLDNIFRYENVNTCRLDFMNNPYSKLINDQIWMELNNYSPVRKIYITGAGKFTSEQLTATIECFKGISHIEEVIVK